MEPRKGATPAPAAGTPASVLGLRGTPSTAGASTPDSVADANGVTARVAVTSLTPLACALGKGTPGSTPVTRRAAAAAKAAVAAPAQERGDANRVADSSRAVIPRSRFSLDDRPSDAAAAAAAAEEEESQAPPSTSAFTFAARIGRSPTSEVWRATHVATGVPFAIKVSTRPPLATRAARDAAAAAEAGAVAGVRPHPNLITLHAAWVEGGRLFSQMDLAGGGSVGRALRAAASGGRGALPEPAVWRVAADGAAALAALAAAGVLHLDVSPDNLFLGTPVSTPIRLGDFGLAVRLSDLQTPAGDGPPGAAAAATRGAWEEGDGRYVAPEALGCCDGGGEGGPASTSTPGPPADVFSLGATLFHLLTGTPLPRGAGGPVAGTDGRLAGLAGPDGKESSPALARLLGSMLAPDPAARPTAAAVAAEAHAVVADASPEDAALADAAFAAAASRRPSWGGDGDGGEEHGGGGGGPANGGLFGTVRLGVAESFELAASGSGEGVAPPPPPPLLLPPPDDDGDDGADPALVGGCSSPARAPHHRRRTPASAPPSPPPGATAGGGSGRASVLLPRPPGGFFFGGGGGPLGAGLAASRAAAAAVADLERAASAMSIDEPAPSAGPPTTRRGRRGGGRAHGAGHAHAHRRPGAPGPISSSDSLEMAGSDLLATVRALSMSMSAD